jgi:Flp pilus assembly protein TadG
MSKLNSTRTRIEQRHGIVAAELAVCLPLLVLLTLAMIETCSMIFLKQSLAVAAYEGAHTAVAPGATTADVQRVCDGILRDRRVVGATVRMNPANLEAIREGQYFEVQVSAATDRNAILPLRFFRGRNLTGAAEYMRELPQ